MSNGGSSMIQSSIPKCKFECRKTGIIHGINIPCSNTGGELGNALGSWRDIELYISDGAKSFGW
jgi:hypothetical protein